MTRYEITHKVTEREIMGWPYLPGVSQKEVIMTRFENILRPKFALGLLEKIREAGAPVVIHVEETVSPMEDGFDRYMELKISAEMGPARSMIVYLPQAQYVEVPGYKFNILKFPKWLNKLLEYFYPVNSQ